jgi:hypothetical protein
MKKSLLLILIMSLVTSVPAQVKIIGHRGGSTNRLVFTNLILLQ